MYFSVTGDGVYISNVNTGICCIYAKWYKTCSNNSDNCIWSFIILEMRGQKRWWYSRTGTNVILETKQISHKSKVRKLKDTYAIYVLIECHILIYRLPTRKAALTKARWSTCDWRFSSCSPPGVWPGWDRFLTQDRRSGKTAP